MTVINDGLKTNGQPLPAPKNQDQPDLASINWADVEHEAARLLSRYLQFDTTNPPGYEAHAIEFLADTLSEQGFEPLILESAPGRANLIVRLRSQADPSAPPCLLYAHADVVPANATEWSIPPFGGHIKNGYVWGRGALDDKGLGIIFIKALCLLQDLGVRLNRDVILLIAADEEVHGTYGVAWLLKHHADLIKAEYVWDEGGVGLYQATVPYHYLFQVAVAEKKPLAIKLVAKGQSGHAAIPQQNNPLDRLIRALTRIKQWKRPARLSKPVIEMLHTLAPTQAFPRSYLFANAENQLAWSLLRPSLESSPFFGPLIQNTINLTMLHGGEASNVVSGQAEARLDMRLLPGEDPLAVLADLRSIINDRHIALEPDELPPDPALTPIDTEFYRALSQTLHQMETAAAGDPAAIRLIVPYLTPGATDSRYFRQAGMKAYGFTPMLLNAHELSRIHGIDERVSTANLRWGIQLVFETLLRLG